MTIEELLLIPSGNLPLSKPLKKISICFVNGQDSNQRLISLDINGFDWKT
jgi:hypothetical protein